MKLLRLLTLAVLLTGCATPGSPELAGHAAEPTVFRPQPNPSRPDPSRPDPSRLDPARLPPAAEMIQPVLQPVETALPPAPQLGEAFRKPVSLALKEASLASVITALAKTTGLNFVLDQDVSPELSVTLVVRDLPFEQVLSLMLKAHQLEQQIVSANTVLIYPRQTDKQRAYRPTVIRSFALANADARQIQNLFKQVLKARDLYVDERLNVLVLRDTPEVIRQAEFLVARLDAADPEVMLEVEVLELSRNKLQELGMKFPDQVGLGVLQGATTTTVLSGGIAQTVTVPGGQLAEGNVDLQRTAALTTYAANPLLLLNLRRENGNSNLLANPRIRVRHRDKARIHIGEKLPVFTTTSTANVGVAASVSYLDVGLKLDVEPQVHEADEVGIKMGLEVSSVVREVPGPQQSFAYIVGTRSASTSLRLRNGQTQVLAGLISDEERRSVNQVPGLGDLPLLGRLFASNRDSNTKTEIVLLITPHVIRAPLRPSAAQQLLSGDAGDLREGTEIFAPAEPAAPAAPAAQ